MGYAIVSDKNIENLEIGDKVLLFGKIGTVAVVSGETMVDWIANQFPKIADVYEKLGIL